MEARLTDVVKRLKRPRTLVVGDLLLDQFVFGKAHRISPEAPIPIVHVEREEYRPGGAANVAWNCAALGARVSACGVIGADHNGAALKKLLRGKGVGTAHITVDAKRSTGTKTRIIAHQQQMVRVDKEHTHVISGATERALLAALRRSFSKTDLIIVSDYQKGTLSPRVCRALILSGMPVLVGLKGGEIEKYRGATGASLNQAELFALSGKTELKAAARELLNTLRLQFLVVTLGERGLVVFTRDGEIVQLPTVAREVYDVTGAGDTVLSAFALGFVSGASISDCAHIANAAAGVVVGKVGTATATREDVARHIQGDVKSHTRKVLKERELTQILKKERERGKKIVFTNGCFDILHAGHAKLLQFAKTHGDILVVGLNSDESVRRLKGAKRPIVEENDRAHVLAACESVDYILIFDAYTPRALIKRIKPDVLVKGEDWKSSGFVGRGFAGPVIFAPLEKGKSTTNIIERVIERNSN